MGKRYKFVLMRLTTATVMVDSTNATLFEICLKMMWIAEEMYFWKFYDEVNFHINCIIMYPEQGRSKQETDPWMLFCKGKIILGRDEK